MHSAAQSSAVKFLLLLNAVLGFAHPLDFVRSVNFLRAGLGGPYGTAVVVFSEAFVTTGIPVKPVLPPTATLAKAQSNVSAVASILEASRPAGRISCGFEGRTSIRYALRKVPTRSEVGS